MTMRRAADQGGWQREQCGHATAALKYTSSLMDVEDENPFFRPWTPEHAHDLEKRDYLSR